MAMTIMSKYRSEKEILDLVRAFEAGTISRADWRHAEHLTVAMYYLLDMPLTDAVGKMRRNLVNHLRMAGVDLEKEMPYHETLTVFWMRAVNDFLASANRASMLDKANELVGKFDKDYPLRFYTREYLFSDEARAGFVEGDISPRNQGDTERGNREKYLDFLSQALDIEPDEQDRMP
jgi:hypothetical protein